LVELAALLGVLDERVRSAVAWDDLFVPHGRIAREVHQLGIASCAT